MNFENDFKSVEGVNLNSGSLSRSPSAVIHAVHAEIDDFEKNPTRSLMQSAARMWDVQKKLAVYFKARPQDLFLRANVTCAMNDFLLGVRLPKRGSIVVSDIEYGAVVNICRLRAARESRELVFLKLRTGADSYKTEDELVAHILEQVPKSAQLAMFSHVITGTGLRLPIAKIGAELRRRNIKFGVDGAHGPGGVPLDFSKLESVDFYGGNLHKWFMGPKGTAFGWAHASVQDEMDPLQGSWTTDPSTLGHHQAFGDGNFFALRMLLSHTQAFASYYGLTETLEYWRERGEDRILKHLEDLQTHVMNEMEAQFGWPLLSPKSKALRGPLVSYKLPEKWLKNGGRASLDLWEKHRVQVSMPVVHGEPCLRLSPHICTTKAQISQAIMEIKNYDVSL